MNEKSLLTALFTTYFLSLLIVYSCGEEHLDNPTQYNYNYCDDHGNYGEMYFFKDGLILLYPNYYCDTNNLPGSQPFKYKKLSDDTIYISRIVEDDDTQLSLGVFYLDLNSELILKLSKNDKHSYYHLKPIKNKVYLPPVNVSIDSTEKWLTYIFYPNYIKRLKERNCQCDSSYYKSRETIIENIPFPDSLRLKAE
jgi:hypothetical protein